MIKIIWTLKYDRRLPKILGIYCDKIQSSKEISLTKMSKVCVNTTSTSSEPTVSTPFPCSEMKLRISWHPIPPIATPSSEISRMGSRQLVILGPRLTLSVAMGVGTEGGEEGLGARVGVGAGIF